MKKAKSLQSNSSFSSHALLRALPYNAFVFTEHGYCIEAFVGNEATISSFDYQSLVGKSLHQMLGPDLVKRLQKHISKAIESELTETIVHPIRAADLAPEFRGLTGLDDTLWFEGKVTKIPDWQGDVNAVMWLSSDITMTISREQKIKALIELDALTGARSRRALLKYLRSAFKYKEAVGLTYSLLYIEVPDYPIYKREYGLIHSESLLKRLSEFFQLHLGPANQLFRFEGSDFVAVLPNTDYKEACIIAKALANKLITTEIEIDQTTLTIPIEVGVSQSRADIDTRPHDVLYRASSNLGKY